MPGTNLLAPVSSTLNIRETDASGLALSATCTGAPPTTANLFAHGCQIVRTDSGTGNKALYENVGSSAVPSWNLIGDITAGEITLAEGNVLVGNASGVATALSAKTSGQILVGNGTTVASVPVTGTAILESNGELYTGVYATNLTGGALTPGTLVISYVDSGTGDVCILKAGAGTAGSGANGIPATHVVVDTIANGATGFVYDSAIITGLNTAGRAVGDDVYLSATAGAFTFTAPTDAAQTKQIVGAVKTVDAVNGTIYFIPGYRLDLDIPANRIQDGVGTDGAVVKKQALVVYDFAVNGGAQGNISLSNNVSIPDNSIVKLVSYDVLTTFTSATDAATVTLALDVDGSLATAIAINDASNPWDQGVFAAGATSKLGLLAAWDPVKTTDIRNFRLVVAGGEDLTAGKAVFQVEYWVSQ